MKNSFVSAKKIQRDMIKEKKIGNGLEVDILIRKVN